MPSLFMRLKERKFVPWMAAYFAAAWFVLEAFEGRVDDALDWLDDAFAIRYTEDRPLRQDPVFAALRDDSRFRQLLERMTAHLDRQYQLADKSGALDLVD